MNDDDRNGGRPPSMHPEAVQALAEETAHRQTAEERWIFRMEDGVEEIRSSLKGFKEGSTEWQQSVTRTLQRLTDQVNILTFSRIIWPSLTALGVLFLGSFAATIVWLLATHH